MKNHYYAATSGSVYKIRDYPGPELFGLCTRITDWEAFGRFCEIHGIGPLVFNAFTSLNEIPQKATDIFQGITEKSLARYVVLTHRLEKILQGFEKQALPVLVLKGPVLSNSIYAKPVLRPFDDLDFLVRHEHLDRAACFLVKNGFSEIGSEREKRFLDSGFHRKFKNRDGVVVELHWELLPPDFRALPVSELWEDSQMKIWGGIRMRTLSDYDEFIYACVHLARHITTYAQAKGIWLFDLQRLIPADIHSSLSVRIRKLHCRKMVYFAVALANRFMEGDPNKVKSWGKALGIDAFTQKLILLNSSPAQVFQPLSATAHIMKGVSLRFLLADDAGTMLLFPVAYLKRHLFFAQKGCEAN